MEYLFVAAVFFVAWLIIRERKESPPSSTNRKSRNSIPSDMEQEAKAVSEKINTWAAYERLEERMYAAQDRIYEAQTPNAQYNAHRKYDVLERACDLALSRVVKFIYAPGADPFLKKFHFKEAYKILTPSRMHELISSLSLDPDMFIEVTVEDLSSDNVLNDLTDPEEREAAKAVSKLRTIIESEATRKSKIKRINKWVEENESSKYSSSIEWWFDSINIKGGLTPGDFFYIEELTLDGLPWADIFYSEGFDEDIKCLDIDPAEFESWYGVGPVQKQYLEDYQDKIRKRIDSQFTLAASK